MKTPERISPPPAPIIAPVAVAADTAPVTAASKSLEQRVREKLSSKAFAVTSQAGKHQFFDITNRNGVDYTIGGMFRGFWFDNSPGRIQYARMKGYYFPSEIDSSLENITNGSMILMLQTAEARKDYQRQIERLTSSHETATMANDPNLKGDARKHMIDFEVIRPN